MTLPHRLIIDGVEQCASDDAEEFLRLAYQYLGDMEQEFAESGITCLLYTSPSPRDRQKSRMPSSA